MSKFVFKYSGREYRIARPSSKDYREARKAGITAFNEAIKSGAMLKSTLNKYLETQGLWTTEDESKFQALSIELKDREIELKNGGIKLTDAHELAIEIRKLRMDISLLANTKSDFTTVTVEGQADDAKFDYLIYTCLVYNETGKRCFSSYEQYLDEADSDLSSLAGTHLMSMMFGLESSVEDMLPELQFLKKYKFLDGEGRVLNTEGKLINDAGHLVDVEGNLIDSEGSRVDLFDNKIENQEFGEQLPFLDDDGNPIDNTKQEIDSAASKAT